MKVKNMISSRSGKSVANQFVVWHRSHDINQCANDECYFQSYNSVIVKKKWTREGLRVSLDITKWDYSVTTGRYRNQFLGETKAETQKKLDSGEYELVDLN